MTMRRKRLTRVPFRNAVIQIITDAVTKDEPAVGLAKLRQLSNVFELALIAGADERLVPADVRLLIKAGLLALLDGSISEKRLAAAVFYHEKDDRKSRKMIRYAVKETLMKCGYLTARHSEQTHV
jgi:hypothetical protein